MSEPSQSKAERVEAMASLMDEFLVIQRAGDNITETAQRHVQIVETTGNYAEQSDGTYEKVIDAKIIAVGSEMVKSYVQAFNTNLVSFSPEEYVSGIVAHVEGRSYTEQMDWDLLSKDTVCILKKTPIFHFMLWSFAIDPPPPPERVKPERQKKSPAAAKDVVATIEQGEQSGELTDTIYQHILECLITKYRKNGKQPINYLEFITDPGDYWRTVENIFHFAFLVRDDKAKMAINSEGMPVVEPTLKKKDSQNSPGSSRQKNYQFNFRLSKNEWRQVIDKLGIKSACITPLA